jgi:hypothetical protein
MSEERRPGLDTEIDDFAEILLPQDGEDLPVIVGGHAVGCGVDTIYQTG